MYQIQHNMKAEHSYDKLYYYKLWYFELTLINLFVHNPKVNI